MKRKWIILKWMAGQTRPYLISLIAMIVFSSLLSLCRVGMAIASKELIDAAVLGFWQTTMVAGGCFIAIIIVQIGLQAITSTLTVRTCETMSGNLRYKLFLHLTGVEWVELSKYHSGDILTRMTSDIGVVVDGIMDDLPEIISLFVGLIAAFITLLIYDPILALFAFLLGPVAIGMSYVIGSRYMMIHMKAQESESKYRSYMQECLEHMLILKAFCYEKESGKQIKKLQGDKIHWALQRNRTSVITNALIAGGYWISYFIAFGWGAFRLYKGSATFGTLTAFLQLIEQVQSPFLGLASTIPQVMATVGSAERLMEFEKLPLERTGYFETAYEVERISMNNVSFEYVENSPVLKDITAEILQGEIIGIIGASGEGKTTLIHLIMSLLQPGAGEINLHNGYKKSTIANASIRSLISYVPQGNTLFSGTISENLQIGSSQATKEEQIESLRGADAWDFVEKLPDQLNTVIGERGVGLSEGQAQRIAIARALLRNTPILILDEATSALDIDTEQRVLQTIVALSPKRTCIIITHRPSILNICQRVWKLNNGKLAELSDNVNAALAIEAV
jgi:ABC-type multidrug transport system fused ATPase/permease subunit